MASDILIVDDEADIRELVSGILEDEGHKTRLAKDSDEAIRAVEERRPSLVILDIWLQGSKLDGLEVLARIKKQHPDLPVVIISGHGNIETAVTAIKRGAYDYIEKPFKADRLVVVTMRAIEAFRLRRENKELKEKEYLQLRSDRQIAHHEPFAPKHPKSGAHKQPRDDHGGARVWQGTRRPFLHACSQRENGPFVAVNAASMAADRVEVEFFGVEETGQTTRKVGALEEAHNGTLYIDEVADMPADTQGKLLRVLVEQKFQRIGGGPKVSVDVRIVSSSSRDLEREMSQGRFRQDLFHRLNVVPLRVPSLIERREDIPELVEHFVKQIALSSGLPPRVIGDDAMAVLQSHEWQGNVRQLRNIVERVMIMSNSDPEAVITADMLPDDIGANVPLSSNGSGGEHLMSLPLRDAREIFEREYLMAQINRFGGNISRTAEFVGMERSALHRKLRALGVNSNERAGDTRH